jgi:hypothetical protein
MSKLTETKHGPFTVYFAGPLVEPSRIVNQLDSSEVIESKGRGGIRIIHAGGFILACRKYLHGGLLRALTGNTFFSSRRTIREIETIMYLRDNSFPVIEPFASVVKNKVLTKDLYLLTVFAGGAVDLLDHLRVSTKMGRFRSIRQLAGLFCRLEGLSIYHPDLHLNNVLVTPEKGMIFLDFDKSTRKILTRADMARMFWRLNRFVEKMARNRRLTVTPQEKVLFLRTYGRLSGYDMLAHMEKKAGVKALLSRIGWFVENALYGRAASSHGRP